MIEQSNINSKKSFNSRNIKSNNSPDIRILHTSHDQKEESYASYLTKSPTNFTTDRQEELEYYRQAQIKSVYKN